MTSPPDDSLTTPLDQLKARRDRMDQLFEQLVTQLPERLQALFDRYPMIVGIVWGQRWPGKGTRLVLHSFFVELDDSVAVPDDVADRAAYLAGIEPEVEALLGSIPATVMVKCFGHSHMVHVRADSIESEFQD